MSNIFIFKVLASQWTANTSNRLPIINTSGSFRDLSYNVSAVGGDGKRTITINWSSYVDSGSDDGLQFRQNGAATYLSHSSVEIIQFGGVQLSRNTGQTQTNGIFASFSGKLPTSPTDIPTILSNTNFTGAFSNCRIPNGYFGNIANWNTTNVINMTSMFNTASSFNQPIGNWNTSNCTLMNSMFSQATSFNQPINTSGTSWNTSNCTNMSNMFSGASAFNKPIGNWNTSNCTDMAFMFYNASVFNQPIDTSGTCWNTSNCTNMSLMFYNARLFNQPVGNWNTSKCTNMYGMFFNARLFNQPVGNWNTSNCTNMYRMFYVASAFNQPIGNWNFTLTTDINAMILYVGYTPQTYSRFLKDLSNNSTLQNNLSLGTASIGLYRIDNTETNNAYTYLTKSVASGGKGMTIIDAGSISEDLIHTISSNPPNVFLLNNTANNSTTTLLKNTNYILDSGSVNDPYRNNENYTRTFQVLNGHVIQIQGSIATELNYDFLTIWEINLTTNVETQIYRNSGSSSLNITSTTSKIKIKFACDTGVNGAGFLLNLNVMPPYTVAELKAAGYTATELKAAGYTIAELKDGGYNATELTAAGYTATELKAAGYTATELKAAGYTAVELHTAGYTATELKDAGYTIAELTAAGYSADEMLAAGYSTTELLIAGYAFSDLHIQPGISEGSILSSQKAMPMKSSTSDGASSFAMGRRMFMETYGANPTPVVIQYPQKKWIGGSRDASQIIANRRMAEMGSTLNVTASPMSFVSNTDKNVKKDALRRARAGGANVPSKVSQKYLNNI